jgi:hypothetical protein
MALNNDPQMLVTAPSDRQRSKRVPKQGSGCDTDGTPATSAEVVQLDTGRPRSPRRRGPKTGAGKARVSGNALIHGISSLRPVVPGESSDEWETHRRAIVEDLAPEGAVETALAERVALFDWRLRRVTAYEVATIAERHDTPIISARLLPHPLAIDKITRYEAHLSRQFFHALHELESRQAARSGQRASLIRLDIHGSPEAVAYHRGGDRVSSPNTGDAVIEGHLSSTPSQLPT